MLIYALLSLAGGFFLSNQNPINANLRKSLNSAFWASTLSQVIASIFLALVSFSLSHELFPSVSFISSHPLWIWIGGFLGPIYVTSNIFLFPRLGAVQTVILPVLGQILMGFAIDSFGYFDAREIPLNLLRVIGVIITILGLVIAVVLPTLKNEHQKMKNSGHLFLQIWAIFSGSLMAIQSAINARLGILLQSAAQASFMSIFLGLILIVTVSFVIEKRLPDLTKFKRVKLWHGLGGIFGPLFVLGNVISLPQIGAGLVIMLGILGQIIGSMLVQQLGWWKSLKAGVSRFQVLGVFVMLLGITLIKFL